MSSYEEALKRLKAEGQYRSMRCVDSTQGAKIVLDGKPVLNFSGNNSLGLAAHPALIEAAHQGLEQYGLGSGASRLISGNMKPHQDLERALAEFMKTEQVRLFASGYQANTGVLPALVEKDDLILSDALNHASLIDGIRLCRAPCEIHPHNDLKALEKALRKAPSSRKIWVVTESLFSMEGDRAPLKEIVALKKERPFMLYVDEAHAVGSLGPQGRGLAAEAGCSEEADLLLGTLGKAFGVCGAFVAARREIAELLVNKARTLIYTTASPPALACAALKALAEVKAADDRRRKLRENIDYFRGQIANLLGLAPKGCDQIVPVPVPGAERVMRASARLLEHGIFCQGIRPPTVPRGGCCLRFSLSSLHEKTDLDQAVDALRTVLESI